MGMAVLLGGETTTQHRLHVAFELSASKWRLGLSDGKSVRQVTIPAGDLKALEVEFDKARRRLELPPGTKTVSCYEAGRDGFWLHRWLASVGVENVVVEPASIQVDRRARRAKTDRLDVEALLRMLVRFAGGERDVWRIVRVPSEEAEDLRRASRERERLKREEVQHRNRIRGLLVLHGVRLVVAKGFRDAVAQARLWNGRPLPASLLAEILRELDRLEFLQVQLARLEKDHRERVSPPRSSDKSARASATKATKRPKKATPKTTATKEPEKVAANEPDVTTVKIRRLMELRGVGIVSATVLVHELFGWRTFRNRREVGAIAGLCGTPYQSGGPGREQGISKAGNPRVRTTMIELAWGWLQWQPDSKLTRDFYKYVGKSDEKTKRRFRKVAVVALARQLLVALWHYVEHGVLPKGAIWRSAA